MFRICYFYYIDLLIDIMKNREKQIYMRAEYWGKWRWHVTFFISTNFPTRIFLPFRNLWINGSKKKPKQQRYEKKIDKEAKEKYAQTYVYIYTEMFTDMTKEKGETRGKNP